MLMDITILGDAAQKDITILGDAALKDITMNSNTFILYEVLIWAQGP